MNLKYRKSKAVILNIGSGKFFLHQTAESLDMLGLLASTISGITKVPQFLNFSPTSKFSRLVRLQNRMKPLDPNVRQIQVVSGELLWQIATLVGRYKKLTQLSKFLYFCAATRFDIAARRQIGKFANIPNLIYHFRAGFGGKSVKVAKSHGIPTICDHSICHPNYDWWIKEPNPLKSTGIFNLERLILNDLNTSDHIIVNSDFVAETFRICGNTRKLQVMTPPIDEKFIQLIHTSSVAKRQGVTFVGTCEFRKGIDVLTEIIKFLPSDISVKVIGNWNPEAISFRSILKNFSNVQIFPFLNSFEISNILQNSLIFIFPSRAEGSARVVGEAMHAGCIPLITKESGLPLRNNAGYLINELSEKEIAELIMDITCDIESHNSMSLAAKRAIQEIEMSYLPNLLNFYDKIGNDG